MFECDFCDRTFDTKRGKGIHEGQSHKEEKRKRYEENNPCECPYCDDRFKEYKSVAKHASRVHDKEPDRIYVDYHHDGEWPTCKCGCGEKVNLQKGSEKGYGFADYKQGHYARDQEGGFWTEEGLKKSAETRRKQFREGDREPWNKGMSLEENPDNEGLQKLHEKNLKENCPERAEKISEALTGREFSEETIEKLTEHWQDYWSDPEHREEQKERRIEYMASSEFEPISELENEFGEILDALNIEYSYQEPLEGFVYDFWLPQTDTYIEVHGDFWHCNPDAGYENPQYPVQERSVENDKKKEKVIEENDKDLLVFWETDINENRKEVIQKLLQYA